MQKTYHDQAGTAGLSNQPWHDRRGSIDEHRGGETMREVGVAQHRRAGTTTTVIHTSASGPAFISKITINHGVNMRVTARQSQQNPRTTDPISKLKTWYSKFDTHTPNPDQFTNPIPSESHTNRPLPSLPQHNQHLIQSRPSTPTPLHSPPTPSQLPLPIPSPIPDSPLTQTDPPTHSRARKQHRAASERRSNSPSNHHFQINQKTPDLRPPASGRSPRTAYGTSKTDHDRALATRSLTHPLIRSLAWRWRRGPEQSVGHQSVGAAAAAAAGSGGGAQLPARTRAEVGQRREAEGGGGEGRAGRGRGRAAAANAEDGGFTL